MYGETHENFGRVEVDFITGRKASTIPRVFHFEFQEVFAASFTKLVVSLQQGLGFRVLDWFQK